MEINTDSSGAQAYRDIADELTCFHQNDRECRSAAFPCTRMEELDERGIKLAKGFAEEYGLPWPPPDIDTVLWEFRGRR